MAQVLGSNNGKMTFSHLLGASKFVLCILGCMLFLFAYIAQAVYVGGGLRLSVDDFGLNYLVYGLVIVGSIGSVAFALIECKNSIKPYMMVFLPFCIVMLVGLGHLSTDKYAGMDKFSVHSSVALFFMFGMVVLAKLSRGLLKN